MTQIVQNGHPTLRMKAQAVVIGDILKPKIKKVLKEMSEALIKESDGVAIAAPQIAYPLRIFVVSGRVFDDDFVRGKAPIINEKIQAPDMIFINPVFKMISKDRKLMKEGCLSVRPLYGNVRRATKATVEAYNERGEKFIKKGTGLLAHIFQHEMDHLDGILFIDKAKDLHESTPDEEFK